MCLAFQILLVEHWINLNLTEHPPLHLNKTEAVGIGVFVLNKAHAVSSGFVNYIFLTKVLELSWRKVLKFKLFKMEYRYIFIEDTAFTVILGAATITAVVGCVV